MRLLKSISSSKLFILILCLGLTKASIAYSSELRPILKGLRLKTALPLTVRPRPLGRALATPRYRQESKNGSGSSSTKTARPYTTIGGAVAMASLVTTYGQPPQCEDETDQEIKKAMEKIEEFISSYESTFRPDLQKIRDLIGALNTLQKNSHLFSVRLYLFKLKNNEKFQGRITEWLTKSRLSLLDFDKGFRPLLEFSAGLTQKSRESLIESIVNLNHVLGWPGPIRSLQRRFYLWAANYEDAASLLTVHKLNAFNIKTQIADRISESPRLIPVVAEFLKKESHFYSPVEKLELLKRVTSKVFRNLGTSNEMVGHAKATLVLLKNLSKDYVRDSLAVEATHEFLPVQELAESAVIGPAVRQLFVDMASRLQFEGKLDLFSDKEIGFSPSEIAEIFSNWIDNYGNPQVLNVASNEKALRRMNAYFKDLNNRPKVVELITKFSHNPSKLQFILDKVGFELTEAEEKTIVEGFIKLSKEKIAKSYLAYPSEINALFETGFVGEKKKQYEDQIKQELAAAVTSHLENEITKDARFIHNGYALESFQFKLEIYQKIYDQKLHGSLPPEANIDFTELLEKNPASALAFATFLDIHFPTEQIRKVLKNKKIKNDYVRTVNGISAYLVYMLESKEISDEERIHFTKYVDDISKLKQVLHRQDLDSVKAKLKSTEASKKELLRKVAEVYLNRESEAVPVLLSARVGNGGNVGREVKFLLRQLYQDTQDREQFTQYMIDALKHENQKIRFLAFDWLSEVTPEAMPPNVHQVMDIYTPEEKASWTLTNPSNHNPRHFKYLVHGVSIREFQGAAGHFFEHNAFEDPVSFKDRKYICASLISPEHQSTFRPTGVILKLPSLDSVTATYDHDGGSNGLYFAKKRPQTADGILEATGRLRGARLYNEIIVYGTNPYNKQQVEISGVFISDSADATSRRVAKEFAKKHRLPVVYLDQK